MAVAETANLLVKLSLTGNFQSQLAKTSRTLKTFDRDSSRAFKAGAQIGTGIRRGAILAAAGVGALVTQVGFGLDSLIKLEGMTAQTEAVLKSTGSVAGVTAVQVRKLAEQYESLNATVGDEVIQNAENLLLTFTKINKKAFEPALQAALDMNQALGGGPEGLAGTAKLLGKALQDPEKGLSRLGRAVGGFSDETVKAVKQALKNNDTLKAQNIILAELERRYGGSFARAGQTTAGSVAKFGDAIEDLQRSLATALLPTVRNVADALTELLADPAVMQGARDLGEDIGKLFSPKNIKAGIGAIKEGAAVLLTISKQVSGIVSTAVGLFTSLPPEIQKLAVGAFAVNKLTGGLVTNLAGGLISAVISSFKGLMNVNAAVVNVNGPVGGLPGKGVPGIPGGLPGGAAGAAGAGAAGIGLGTVAVLAIAPASIAALGIAITNAVDPTHRGATQGRADTARARGIPDANNKPLQELNKIKIQLGQNKAGDDRNALLQEQALKRTASVLSARLEENKAQGQRTAAAVKDADSSIDAGTRGTTIATQAGAASIRAAIFAARPIINVDVQVAATSITKVNTTVNRYGSTAGSRQKDVGSGLGRGSA